MNNSYDQTKYNDFMRRRDMLSNLIKRQLAILSSLRLTNLETTFKKLDQDVLTDTFKVLVIGEFKRGKSTFINAMLGQKVLPAFATPTTAIISEVKWGEKPQAFLQYLRRKDGSPGRKQEILPADLEQYVVIRNDQDFRMYESPYEKVELFWPLEICKNGIEIIDSPGLNEDLGRQSLTLDYLSTVDAVIFVISCDSPISLSERSSIDTIVQSGHTRTFFICNRLDIIDEDQQKHIKRYCREKLKQLTNYGERYIFFISARNALKGRESDDSEKVKESGLLEVEAALKTFLATERGRIKILLPALELQEAINDIWQDLPNREKMLHIDLSTAQTRQIQAERELQKFEAEHTRIVNHLDKFRLQITNYVESAAMNFYRDLATKIPGWAREYKVKKPVQAQELILRQSRDKALERVIEEITKYLTDQVSLVSKEWQMTTLLPELNTRTTGLNQELNERMHKFVSGLEQIRLDLGANRSISDSKNRRSANSISNVEELLSMSDTLVRSHVNVAALGTVFGFKNILMFTPSVIVPPLILLLGWNPLLLIPVSFVAAAIVGFRGGPAITQKIKEEVSKQYEAKFNDYLSDLVTAVAKDVDDKLLEVQDNLNQRLSLKIHNIRDQVAAVLLEKERGQARVDEAIREIDVIREELKIIEDEVRDLQREVINEFR